MRKLVAVAFAALLGSFAQQAAAQTYGSGPAVTYSPGQGPTTYSTY